LRLRRKRREKPSIWVWRNTSWDTRVLHLSVEAKKEPSAQLREAWGERQFAKFAIALIIGLAAIAHGPSLGNGFTNWDDPMLVTENTAIRSLAPSNLLRIFTPGERSYQPVRVLSYAIDYAIWEYRPFGYHLVNLLLHLGAAVLLFFTVRALLDRLRTAQAGNRVAALLVALLFAVHPVNVESVAWVSSRKYGLLVVFSFLAIFAFLRERRVLSVLALVLAILSSPFAVVIPFLLGLIQLCAPDRRSWKPLLPHVLALGLLAIPMFAGLANASKHSTEVGVRVGAFAHAPAEPLLRFYTMSRVCFDYGRNLCLPLWLNNNYLNRLEVSALNIKILLTWLAALALGFCCVRAWRRKQRMPAFCAGWALISWLPVANIIPISTSMADRYLYLAAIGPFLALALALERWNKPEFRRPLFTLVGAVLILLTLFSAARSTVWRDSESLWRDSLSKQGENPVACYNLGAELLRKKQIDEGVDLLRQALRYGMGTSGVYNNLAHGLIVQGKYYEASLNAREALILQPRNPRRHAQLAQTLLKTERYRSAARFFNSALQLDPEMVIAWVGLGRANLENGALDESVRAFQQALDRRQDLPEIHNGMGMAHAARGEDEAAVGRFRKALELSPEFAEAHFNLGTLLDRQGDSEGAFAEFAKATELHAQHPEAWNNWGMALAKAGQSEAAIAKFAKALELRPKYAQAAFNLANVERALGKLAEAEAHYHQAIKDRPRYAAAYNNLGTLLLQQERLDEAAAEFAKAIQFDPRYARAHYNLGTVSRQQRNWTDAIRHFSSAAAIDPDYFAAHFNLTLLHAQAGERDKAREHLAQLRRLQPEHPQLPALTRQLDAP
jgi:tetratricopeptide (TPR) repeat protein